MLRRELEPLGAVARGDRAVAAGEPLADEPVHLRVVLDDEDGREAAVLAGFRGADGRAEGLERLPGGLLDAALLVLRGPPDQRARWRLCGDAEREKRAPLGGVGNLDRSAVHLREVPGDREAEP